MWRQQARVSVSEPSFQFSSEPKIALKLSHLFSNTAMEAYFRVAALPTDRIFYCDAREQLFLPGSYCALRALAL